MANTGRDFLAGAGLGLLTGTLIGLSASSVVAVVVGAISAAMLPLLGIVEKSRSGAAQTVADTSWRVAGFGLFSAAAVISGVYIRTNDWLSPSISTQISSLTQAGFSKESAREWVSIKNLGTSVEKEKASADGKAAGGKAVAGPASSVLFSTLAEDECPSFDPAKFSNSGEQLAYLKSRGGKFAAFARSVEAQSSAGQAAALGAAKHLFCPE